MNAERQRILQMVADRKITPDDAARLIDALPRSRASVWRWLTSPLELLDTRTALGVGASFGVLQLLITRLQVRFDGTLDSHVIGRPVSWPEAILDLAVAWPLTAAAFFAVAWLPARKGRFIDFLAAVGIARLPLLLAAILTGLVFPGLPDPAAKMPSPELLAIAFGTIPFVIWFVTLLVTGFRTASGLRGWKLAVLFIASLAVAETASKLALLAVTR
jgi:hypothetical protein